MDSENILHGPEFAVPPPDISLGRYITQLLPLHEEKIAQICAETGKKITFGEIYTKSLSIAHSLHKKGIKPGDVVGICSENNIDFFLPVLASFFIGAACAPFNPAYTVRELHHVMNISKPRIVFCSKRTLDRVAEMSQKVKFQMEIVVFGNDVHQKHIPFSAFLQDNSKEFSPIDGDPNELVATILCSSGTTGFPKGVMLTHKNILCVLCLVLDPSFRGNEEEEEPELITIGLLPFFHAMSFMSQIINITYGIKCIVMSKYNEELLLKSIEKYKVTVVPVVPPIAAFLAKATIIGKYDLSSIKVIQCGAAPLSKDIEIKLKERLQPEIFSHGYGLTEATLGLTASRVDEHRTGSVGKLLPGVTCKVVDLETEKNQGPYKSGELRFRGPNIMKGYYGNEEATSASFDRDGFLCTGDVGYYDEDGFFYIVDRIKELIKYKGYQVAPAELEALLLSHHAIKDVGVVGVSDKVAGELPLAFVVKEPKKSITKQEILKFVEEQVSPQKKLRGGVIFVNSIPRTPSGKILRRKLKEMIKSSKL